MKKLLLLLFIFCISSFCFSEGATNSQEIEFSVEEMQNELLQSLNNGELSSDILDILQENNEIISQENEKIALEEEKKKEFEKEAKARKKKAKLDYNMPLGGMLLGFDIPFYAFLEREGIEELSTSNFGLSVGMFGAIERWSAKVNVTFDYHGAGEDVAATNEFTFSLGRAPIHNEKYLLGYYFTYGIENAGCGYIFHKVGTSGIMGLLIDGAGGLFINCDVSYRVSKNSGAIIVPRLDDLLKTWRVTPSIGVFLSGDVLRALGWIS